MGRGRGRPYTKKGLAREELFTAAKSLFAEHGFDGTHLKMISEKAGYNATNIYCHWKNKEDLFAELTSNVETLDIHEACDHPLEFAMVLEKKLSEDGTLIKKISELSPELLVSML